MTSIVHLFELGRRNASDRFEKTSVIEPVDPLESCELDLLDVAPRTSLSDHFGLVQPDDRFGQRVALESEGYSVLEAAEGREGVRLYREHRPALVLVDIVMPEKDGIETVREILATDPAAVIFAMSGKDGAEDHNEVARMLGARRGFRKPVRVEDLLGVIDGSL